MWHIFDHKGSIADLANNGLHFWTFHEQAHTKAQDESAEAQDAQLPPRLSAAARTGS